MKWKVLLIAALAVGATGRLAAQSQGIGIVPFAGYTIPGNLADGSEVGNPTTTYTFKPKAAPFVGVQLELGVSKNMSVGAGGNLTFGQKGDIEINTSGGPINIGDALELSQMQFYGALILRPMGRLPTGAVTPLAIEVGGGYNMWRFDKFVIQQQVFTADDWNGGNPFAFAGVAFNVPIGPRASLQLFARGQMQFGYSSTGLDDFNNASPPSTVEGSTALQLLFGAGLRVGR